MLKLPRGSEMRPRNLSFIMVFCLTVQCRVVSRLIRGLQRWGGEGGRERGEGRGERGEGRGERGERERGERRGERGEGGDINLVVCMK